MYHWGILFIDELFVSEPNRNKQFGSYLLKKVEDEAKVLGATLSHTDTFDFQAKDFYLKQGYEIFGILENCPPNHRRFYMKKIL
jgi:GNAT superfamily N-acetyltransferase